MFDLWLVLPIALSIWFLAVGIYLVFFPSQLMNWAARVNESMSAKLDNFIKRSFFFPRSQTYWRKARETSSFKLWIWVFRAYGIVSTLVSLFALYVIVRYLLNLG